MNEAMSKVKDALAKIDKAREVVNALCDGRIKWTLSVPARPKSDPDLVIADALRSAEEALSALSNVEQEPTAWAVFDGKEPIYSASYALACHEHINDAINEHDIEGAAAWKVVPLYTSPIASGKDVKDAERYRWLRDVENGGDLSVGKYISTCDEYPRYEQVDWLYGDQLDAACDAALAQKGGGNG